MQHCDINQVLPSLIVDAAHADARGAAGAPAATGTLGVSACSDGDDVLGAISDTGCGIPDDVRSRTFDPFFTILIEKHGGS